jgi:plastocyanin
MKKIIVLSLGILLIAAACNKSATVNPTPNPTPPVTQNPTPPPPPATSDSVTISMISTGFSPSTITVKKGTKVTFLNNDTKSRWPASGPHPTHTDLSGFDSGRAIDPGSSYVFTFAKVGTWGFHDHLNPIYRGSVTVTE